MSYRSSEVSPLFSVITPAYNFAPYLNEALDSLIMQTFSNWEGVCVDDGSCDESGEILDNAVRQDGRFRVIHQRNQGVSSARNRGLRSLQGEWLLFLDGDDWFNKSLLSELVKQLKTEKNDYEMMIFRLGAVQDGKMSVSEDYLGDVVRLMSVPKWLSEKRIDLGFSRFAYRIEKLLEFFEPLVMGEDVLFLRQCLLRSECALFVPIIGYYYRIGRQGSAVSTPWTFRKFCDQQLFQIRCLECEQGHSVAYAERKFMGRGCTEGCAVILLQLPKQERARAWQVYIANVCRLSYLTNLDPWTLLTTRIVRALPFVWVCYPVMLFPYFCRYYKGQLFQQIKKFNSQRRGFLVKYFCKEVH